jgi:hypothetical protein
MDKSQTLAAYVYVCVQATITLRVESAGFRVSSSEIPLPARFATFPSLYAAQHRGGCDKCKLAGCAVPFCVITSLHVKAVVSFSSLHSNTLGEHAAVAPFVSTAP